MSAIFGRTNEVRLLVEALEQAEQGHGSLVVLSGEAGIGKSRLLRELEAYAVGRSVSVLWGRAWEAGGAPAFWPWTQVFRRLGGNLFDAPQPGAEPSQRFALFDEATRALAEAAREKPCLVLLDDLHVADVPSLLLLLFIAREIRGLRVLMVGAARESYSWSDPEPGAVLAKIRREATVLPLLRLTAQEVSLWVAARSAAHPEQIHLASEGNPLFVEELLRVGFAPGTRPKALGAVFDEHLSRVTSRARALLDAAAVLGREFTVEGLSAAFALPPDEVAHDTSAAIAAGLLAPGERGACVFSHALLRDHLYERLPPTRRAELHWRAGMCPRGAGEGATAAHHLLEGCAAGHWHAAAVKARDAAQSALAGLGYEEAAALAQRALVIVQQGSALACELELVRAEALIRIGKADEGRKLCRDTALIAAALKSPELIAKAALAFGTEQVTSSVDNQMVELLRLALEHLPAEPSALRARVTARLAVALSPPVAPEEAAEIVDLTRASVTMAREVGDKHALLYVCSLAVPTAYLVSFEDRLALVLEAVGLARELGQRLALERISAVLIMLLIEQGRRAEANVELHAYEELVSQLPCVHRWRLLSIQSVLALLDGRRDDALRLSDESRALASPGSPAESVWGLQRVAIAQAFGDPAAIVPDAAEILRLGISKRGRHVQSWVLVAMERRAEALAAFECTPGFPPALLDGATCVLAKDLELAARVYPLLQREEPHNRMFWGLAGSSAFGPSSRVLGDLALLLGRRDEAATHYHRAVEHCRRMGAEPLLARSLEGLRACGVAPRALGPEPNQPPLTVHRDGELWVIEFGATMVRLKHSKGAAYLEQLVLHVGRELHVLALIGAEHGAGDAGPILDARAKAEYGHRLEVVDARLELARSLGDERGVDQARLELDALAEQLAGAVGLGGRDRRAASTVERARINVQRRLKDTLESVGAADAALGRYLQATVKTGTFCSFMPL